jgi:hypothetical protein
MVACKLRAGLFPSLRTRCAALNQKFETMSKILLCLSMVFFSTSCQAADEDLPLIEPAVARQYVGQKIQVKMEVRAAKHSLHRKTTFLDSELDFRDEKNLGIAISEQGLADLEQQRGIVDAVQHFLGKTIVVRGTIELKEDRPYLAVDAATQIVQPEKSGQ